jgi:hypothetical protein
LNIAYSNDQQRLQYIGTRVSEETAGKAPRAGTPRIGRYAAAMEKPLVGSAAPYWVGPQYHAGVGPALD